MLTKTKNWLLITGGVLILTSPLTAQNAVDHLAKGDAYANAFDNDKALAEYMAAYHADSSNCTALWKIAEAHIDLGEEAQKSIQRQHYYLAEQWARKALAQCPDTANAHFFVAVSSGLIALYEGGKTKVQLSRIVKDEAEKTLALDPNHHGAYHVLGRWNREIANLSWILKLAAKIIYGGVPPGASNEAAVASFKKAIAIKPDWINHHKELGITYMKMKKWELAKQEFERVLKLPIADHQDDFHKQVCRKLLEEIAKKH
ncbi:MAG: hypothetical protein ACE5HO_11050 [bacterium]